MSSHRPSYGIAAIAALTVLFGYVLTLAPSVTFWDAGEFIAATKILGVPHPPGTPLFVAIAHVWAALVPLAEYAQRLNLLSAVAGAVGAGFWFLVAEESLAGATAGMPAGDGRVVRLLGGFAAAVCAAFTFTQWQNSNETEVYSFAVFTIAAICWTCLRWRAVRGTARAPHLLLLIIYLAGMSIGNHLLALLAGPAVIAFLFVVVWGDPETTAEQRAAELSQVAVMAGTWALLIGSGLGSTTLVVLGGLCYVAAMVFAFTQGNGGFGIAALLLAAVGVTSYLILYLRAGHAPMINEAQPDNWDALLAVIRREQYPVRTPLDNPTQFHGPENTGRSLTILGLQLLNYLQYFVWQWGNSLRSQAAQVVTAVVFFSLGFTGFLHQRRSDRGAWWLLFVLWLTTGLGLVAYMNFKPGFSLGYDKFPTPSDHEVRERDYFFVVSFVTWGVWVGIGLARALQGLVQGVRWPAMAAALPVGLVALGPFAANFETATRKHGPDATLAADFAYDLLNSVPPYSILFTYGDNDTFPLWWAQEVQGIRQDVLVVCLALSETDWYKRQLRDWPVRDFDEARAPALWKGLNPVKPSGPAHSLTDEQIATMEPVMLPQDVALQIGPIRHVLAKGTPLYSRDFVVLRLLQDNLGKRPIAWSMTTGGEYYGLEPFLVQRGLVMALQGTPVDTTQPGIDTHRLLGVALDVPATERLMNETYRYARLEGRASHELEPTAAGVSNNLALPLAQLAYAYDKLGQREKAVATLTRAANLGTNPAMKRALDVMVSTPADAPIAPSPRR